MGGRAELGRHDPHTLTGQLEAVLADLARNGWHTDPIHPAASDTELAGRLVWERRRQRVMAEATATQARAIAEATP